MGTMWPVMRFLTIVAVLSSAASADDWPQWRGPGRDGVWHEMGIVESFPPGGLKILWRVPVGTAYSSPVVADGRVFVTDAQLVRPKPRERVLCFEEATGKPLWSHSYEVAYNEWVFTPAGAQGP